MPGREFILDVTPNIPEPLARLEELANNLWYSWDRPTRALFGPLDPVLWNRVGHNPKLFLRRVQESKLREAAADQVFLANYHKVLSAYDTYHGATVRAGSAARLGDDDLIAYFCAEYGLHESLHIYSGGLGILAGHHCKTASDLRLPFVALGLLYRAGYFTQEIDGEGNQVAGFVESDFDCLPIQPVREENGAQMAVEVRLAGRSVRVHVWQVRVGHVRLYLLDTNVEGNAAEDRDITRQLYGGNRETRIKQEIILGEGGVKAIRRLGLTPTVWHLNEGHPAFVILERVRELVQAGKDFAAALEAVSATTVFTTHTPVPAGHDHFSEQLAMRYFEPLISQLGVSAKQLLDLGRLDGDGPDFNMTTLALTGSRHHNGVSRIHGDVSARMCRRRWPQVPAAENPMRYITNGVHVPTALFQDWVELFDRALGADWRNQLSSYDFWQRVHEIPDHLFWSVSQSIKSKLLAALKEALLVQHLRNEVSEPHLDRILRHIDPSDPNVLTVGFARRFATYKRANLVLHDLDWLRELLSDAERPVVIVFAGKAHPADEPGKGVLREIHAVTQRPEFVGKVLLVEGYDLGLARRLVAGVDVWLNNPVYSMEASGTSGMKAAINGTINLSVTDGWWGEGFDGDNGWAIRPSPHDEDEKRRDAEDARTLYETLQDDVIPLYYARSKHGYAPGWVHMCKRSMATVLPRFNMSRVVNEYIDEMYVPAAHSGARLVADGHAGARELARWKERVREAWPGVRLELLREGASRIAFGEEYEVEVGVELNGLAPDDVAVELRVYPQRHFKEAIVGGGFTPAESRAAHAPRKGGGRDPEALQSVRLEPLDGEGDGGMHRYRVALVPEWCGRVSCRVRMYPHHRQLTHPLETGLMVWL